MATPSVIQQTFGQEGASTVPAIPVAETIDTTQLYAVAIGVGIISSAFFNSGGPAVLWKSFVRLVTFEDPAKEREYRKEQGKTLLPIERTLGKLYLFGLFPASVYMFLEIQGLPWLLSIGMAAYNWAVIPAVVLLLIWLNEPFYLEHWESIMCVRFLVWTADWSWRAGHEGLHFRDMMMVVPLYKLLWGILLPRLKFQVPAHVASTAGFLAMGVRPAAGGAGAVPSWAKGWGLYSLVGAMHLAAPAVLAWDKEARARRTFTQDWEARVAQEARLKEQEAEAEAEKLAARWAIQGQSGEEVFCQACPPSGGAPAPEEIQGGPRDAPESFLPDLGALLKGTRKRLPKVDLPPPPEPVPELDPYAEDLARPRKDPRVTYTRGPDGRQIIKDLYFSDSDVEYDEDADQPKMLMSEEEDADEEEDL